MLEENEREMLLQNTPTSTDVAGLNEFSEKFQPKIAGFWVRFWAYIIDLIVISSVGGLIIKPIFRVFSMPITNPMSLFFSPYKVTLLIVTLLYFLLMTKFLQQTVGKMIMGIKVIAKKEHALNWGSLVFREVIGRFISKVLLFPYLLVAVMPRKEALHDLFADTYVVHENVYEKTAAGNYSQQDKGEQLQEQPNV